MKRYGTEYPGVVYRLADRIGGKGQERVYYIRFKRDGKILEEKVGRQYADDMTPAKAARVRADRIENRRMSRKEIREAEKSAGEKWTLSKLWEEYEKQKPASLSLKYDKYRFDRHLKPKYGDKAPSELHQLDTDRLRINLLKEKSPQTVKHVLGLLKRLCNFGVKKQLCPGIGFKIEMPRVDNQKTEDLSPEQLKALLKAIDETTDREAAGMLSLALYTGMRRGEICKLKWEDVDVRRGFVHLRAPKGGKSQTLPLNDQAKKLLEDYPKIAEHVFVRSNKKPFTNVINKRVRPIVKAAGLPTGFRPFHGLRHVYASMLASSGEVDMYTLQKLLTHKSPLMTQRYAHLRDETLRRASTVAGRIIEQAAKKDGEDAEKENKSVTA